MTQSNPLLTNLHKQIPSYGKKIANSNLTMYYVINFFVISGNLLLPTKLDEENKLKNKLKKII